MQGKKKITQVSYCAPPTPQKPSSFPGGWQITLQTSSVTPPAKDIWVLPILFFRRGHKAKRKLRAVRGFHSGGCKSLYCGPSLGGVHSQARGKLFSESHPALNSFLEIKGTAWTSLLVFEGHLIFPSSQSKVDWKQVAWEAIHIARRAAR